MASPELWHNPYHRINLILAGLIVVIFLYAGIFPSGKSDFPVKCIHRVTTGQPCPTCGITHSFSEILKGNFDRARQWNRNGIPVFLFFFMQLFMRVGYSLVRQLSAIPVKTLVITDVALSILLFAVCFRRLIPFWNL